MADRYWRCSDDYWVCDLFFPDQLNWIGRLPGDIRIEKENFRFYFPLTTLLIINLVIWLLMRVWRWLS